MTRMRRMAVLVAVILGAAASVLLAQGTGARPVVFPAIDTQTLLGHVKVLASDDYGGRAPGSRGEDLTVNYIADQFARAGLKPGNTDGTFFQKVPLVGMTPDAQMVLTLAKPASSRRLRYLEDFVAWTRREAPFASLDDSPLVFVGYGVQAPEYNWDDYKGVDVRGKTVVMLINDPPVPDPKNPSRLNPAVFGGEAMTYYGRWTYKYDIAARMGAAGVLIVHETEPAGYDWPVVKAFGGERFDLVTTNRNADKSSVEGWLTEARAREMFVLAGQNFDRLKQQAATRQFRPVPLGVSASLKFANAMRRIDSRNVIGRLDGSDPNVRAEAVAYVAHWDHLGTGPEGIFHGAADNASGVAGLIETARAFARSRPAPRRSLLFIATTAEEQGLLGSAYYASHMVVPAARTLAVINIDVLNVHGRTKDVTVVGLGQSELDEYVRRAAERQQRVVHGDLEPSKGYYYRSDHFEFAKAGVPGLYVDWVRKDFIGRPATFGRNVADHYSQHDYHQPSDVVKPEWDMKGAVEDLQMLWLVGREVAAADRYPQWKPGSEFRARREDDLKRAEGGRR